MKKNIWLKRERKRNLVLFIFTHKIDRLGKWVLGGGENWSVEWTHLISQLVCLSGLPDGQTQSWCSEDVLGDWSSWFHWKINTKRSEIKEWKKMRIGSIPIHFMNELILFGKSILFLCFFSFYSKKREKLFICFRSIFEKNQIEKSKTLNFSWNVLE